jgi:hypothetical protein
MVQFKPVVTGKTPQVIYVFDKDSKTVFTLGRDYSFNKYKVNYMPSDGVAQN